MAVKIVTGDLFKSSEDVIGHQVNCKGVMGSGVAKQVRRKYPEVYEVYVEMVAEYTQRNESLLGKVQVKKTYGDKWVANLFGQEDYGYAKKQYTNCRALQKALITLKEFCKDMKLSVALPYRIGSDRGGADWSEVLGIIEEVFDDYDVTLYKI